MSEPSRWGPPGLDTAGPTVPLPTSPASRQTALRQAGPRPATPRPTAAYPTRQGAQFAPPADRNDYRDDDYRDDDRGAYRGDSRDDNNRDDHRDERQSARPRSRGQIFAGLVLVLALVLSALLGMLTYQTLASVDLISEDPLGGVTGQATILGAVAFGALGVFVLALIALAIARPKALAGIALAASLLLPVGAVVLGVMYGGAVLRQNVETDLAAAQSDITSDGAAAARTVLEELKRNGVDPGPLGDLIIQIAGQG